MPKCPKCNNEVKFGEKICPECGQNLYEATEKKVADVMNTPDITADFDAKDIEDNKIMGVLAYLGLLVLIPIFAAPKSKYARFHSNQGLILFIVNTILQIACEIIGGIPIVGFIGGILGPVCALFGFIFTILGIINVVNGLAKELPIIGKYKILK